MNAKKVDKIATVIFYIISMFIVVLTWCIYFIYFI